MKLARQAILALSEWTLNKITAFGALQQKTDRYVACFYLKILTKVRKHLTPSPFPHASFTHLATGVTCNSFHLLLNNLQANNQTGTQMLKPLFTSIAVIACSASTGALAQTVAPETVAASTEAQSMHTDWTVLLGKYVKASPDGLNRFDYGGLKANAADSAKLDAYVAQFATLDMENLTRAEQYVTWVNVYNALTVQYIRDRYPTKSIRSGYIIGPWKKVFTTVDGEKISLNDIEHEVLRKDWSEPRTHYAVNCASYGCPNLKTTAWEVTTLEADLTQAARDYINHPRGVTIRRDGKLQVSTIYKWFKEDFGKSEANIIAHLRQYASPELRAKIDANPDIKNYEYDWSLNDTN